MFDDPWYLSILDGYDERCCALGLVDGVLPFLVVHTFCISDSGKENIRVISARKATAFERTQYENLSSKQTEEISQLGKRSDKDIDLSEMAASSYWNLAERGNFIDR